MIRISLKEKERQLIARKAELGGILAEQVAAARNRGGRRTPKKRALLEEIAAEARRQGQESPFVSRF